MAQLGSGYGSGSGDGSGYGSGSGSGSGDGSYWKACLDTFAMSLPRAQRDRLAELAASGAAIAYWNSGANGEPCNGGRGLSAAVGSVHVESGPLMLCSKGTLHATHLPTKWKGERWWIVALIGEVIGDREKFGALKREIIGECIFEPSAGTR